MANNSMATMFGSGITASSSPADRMRYLDQQIAAYEGQRGTGVMGNSYYQGRDAYDALIRQRNALAMGGGAGGGAGGSDRVNKARDSMYDLAKGDLARVSGDPMDALIMEKLRGRIEGGGPFDEATKNAMFTNQAQMAAGAEESQLARLRARGLSPSDPAYQSAAADILANRQGQVMDGRLAVNMTANRENYAAQGQNLSQASGINGTRNDRITDASRNLQGLHMRETATVENGGGGYSMPMMMAPQQPAQSYNYNQAPAPRPAPAPAPRPGVAPVAPRSTYTYTASQAPVGTGANQVPAGTGYVQLSGRPASRTYTQATAAGDQPYDRENARAAAYAGGMYAPRTPAPAAQQQAPAASSWQNWTAQQLEARRRAAMLDQQNLAY